jgi:hypothetical protein
MSPSVRRAAALLVTLAALALLAARAVESVTPLGASLSVAKRFWRAGSQTCRGAMGIAGGCGA